MKRKVFPKTNFFILAFVFLFSLPAFSKNLAVIPFQNLTGDESRNWIGAGFSETLTTKLSNVNGILMLERAQLSEILQEMKFQMAGYVDVKTAVDTGKMYGADVLVIGSYQLMDDILKVNARFVDVEKGAVIKAMETSGKLSDIFKLQDEIAFDLTQSIDIVLSSDEKIQVAKNPTENLTAYELFNQGYEAAIILKDYDLAIKCYTQAIELNPKYAAAYYNRGNVYYFKALADKTLLPHMKNRPNAEQAIKDYTKAIELNPNLSEAHSNRGLIYAMKGLHDVAIADFNKAIELNPKLAKAYINRGIAYAMKGLHDAAIADCSKAIELNPKYTEAYISRGLDYAAKGLHDEAIKDFTQAIELNPKNAIVYLNRAVSYAIKGLSDAAIADFNKAIELNPKNADIYYFRGLFYQGKGLNDAAVADLKKAIDMGNQSAREILKKYFNIDY